MKGKSGKLPVLEKRYQKIVETQNGRGCAFEKLTKTDIKLMALRNNQKRNNLSYNPDFANVSSSIHGIPLCEIFPP